jgi:CubicO group peptidase (beta-lactamase class C family)/D-alanyl-D-alanine dipeptidase
MEKGILLLVVGCTLLFPRFNVLSSPLDSNAVTKLQKFILHEMNNKRLPALSIAIVEKNEIVYKHHFGFEHPKSGIAISDSTIVSAGSVSQLLITVAVMRLVEQGKVSLDSPVTRYLPELKIAHRFGRPLTLRNILSHHSGIVREFLVGSSFDPTSPSLEHTVLSLNQTDLIYEPSTRFKYSNAGFAIAARVVERCSNKPFEQYIREEVLEPLDLRSSSFGVPGRMHDHLATSYLWTYHKNDWTAPRDWSPSSSGTNFYTTMSDLSLFALMILNNGRSGNGKQILQSASIDSLEQIQFATPGQSEGYGLGFSVGSLDGMTSYSQSGMSYGFSTSFKLVPQAQLGICVTTTVDCANIVCERISDYASRLLLAQQQQRKLPDPDTTTAVIQSIVRPLIGEYTSKTGDRLRLIWRNGRLLLDHDLYINELKLFGDTLIIDDRLAYGLKVYQSGDSLEVDDRMYGRTASVKPNPCLSNWNALIGEYGWDNNILYIYEDRGTLTALIEWFYRYPLKQMNDSVFALPDDGRYAGEKLVFQKDNHGHVSGVSVGPSVLFERRGDAVEGEQFKIVPLKSISVLRKQAMRSLPPKESGEFMKPDLVDVTTLDPSFKLDIRYATRNNFVGEQFYESARAFLQRPAAEAMERAAKRLAAAGMGIIVYDAYRPWYVTKMFWDATPNDKKDFVADPAKGSRHNRGCAVDMGLYDLATGAMLPMVSGYDEFTDRAYPDYPGGTSLQRWYAEQLRMAMESEDFSVYQSEWWHFDYKDYKRYPILNIPFHQLR